MAWFYEVRKKFLCALSIACLYPIFENTLITLWFPFLGGFKYVHALMAGSIFVMVRPSFIYSHWVPFRRCIRYSTSTTLVKGMTYS